jgi:transposase-like protein
LALESGRPIAHVAADLGINSEVLRKRVRQAEADAGLRPDLPTSEEREEIKRLRRVSLCIPRSAATCAIGRPLSSANRTPRSSSSSGYFLGLDMTAENLLSPGQHPGSEVSAKPGPAQGVSTSGRCWPPLLIRGSHA